MQQPSNKPFPRRVVLLGSGVLAVCLLGAGLFSRGGRAEGVVYLGNPRDCICGLNKLRQLTHPARVGYPEVLAATPYMRELVREGIDPDSARGVTLRTRAEGLVYRVCSEVRKERGHCSVWKALRRKDRKPIPDVTRIVLARVQRFVPDGEPAR